MTKCCGQESYGSDRPRNDRRLQIIDEVKQFIGDMENEERKRMRGSGKKRGGVVIPGVRDMEEECLQYRKRRDCSPPTITSIAIHETRPTSMFDVMKYENSSRLTFVDASQGTDPFDPMPPAPWELPRTPSQELRAGNLYMSCDCRKRNGLQHDCPRWECGGRPTCQAVNPGPCCEPSKARKPVRGDRRHGGSQNFFENQRVLQNDSPTAGAANYLSAEGKDHRAKDPTATAMMCLCEPVGASRPSPPTTQVTQGPRPGVDREFVGIVAVTAQGLRDNPAERKDPPSKEPGAMVCLCKPTGACKSSPPVSPVAIPQVSQRPRPGETKECVGIVAVSQSGNCDPSSLQGRQGYQGPQRPQPSGDEVFIAVTPTGGKYLCCPMPS